MIIFSVLTIVAMAASTLHLFFLKQERLELTDQQVRETATALLDSEINSVRNIEFERVDEILSEELGESRIGKFFIIRDNEGHLIFESQGVKSLPIKHVPREPQWITFNENGKFIRILNLKLPRIPDRTLQVGVMLDESLIFPSYFSIANLAFIGCIFLLGFSAAWGLTSTLLKPISRLVEYITGISSDSGLLLPPLPMELARLKSSTSNKRDELLHLINSFSGLVEKVNRGYKISRIWSYQMAHELKTPLAIAEGEIDQAKKSGELKAETATKILDELMEASETVTAFLSWAELEGASAQKNLYAVSVQKTLFDFQRRLNGKFPNRLVTSISNDFYILTGIQHFEHMLLNLILNALIYSPEGEVVEVKSTGVKSLCVVDRGPGIPEQVIERMGEPFNKGDTSKNSAKGHGLGLAYVQSVCRLYGWKIWIQASAAGTRIQLDFRDAEDESGPGISPKPNPPL